MANNWEQDTCLASGCTHSAVLTQRVPPSGTRGGRVCTVQKRVLPAHPRARTGRTPLSAPARHHGGPGHCAPPAGALRPTALQADGGLPEGQPPMFTRSPGTGLFHKTFTLWWTKLSGHLAHRISVALVYFLSTEHPTAYFCFINIMK